MRKRTENWLYVRVSLAVLLAGLVVGLIAESPATSTTPPTTSVLRPASGATLSGTTATLAASASNATSVAFSILGGTYGFTRHQIGTATSTPLGWTTTWNTTTVPNGSYVLYSEALNGGSSAYSAGVTITVANPLTTSVLIPAPGATLSGTTATWTPRPRTPPASRSHLGRHLRLHPPPDRHGHVHPLRLDDHLDTTTAPNGSYVLYSEALNGGSGAFSAGVTITIANPLTTSVLIPASGATLSGTTATLDASASNATSVQFSIVGGTYGLPTT